jgi:hypothetical protein
VYEPVLADLRNPRHYTRRHGPSGDPETYLDGLRSHVERYGVTNGRTAALPDPISAAAGCKHI